MEQREIRSLEDLYERYSGAVFRYLVRLSGDPHLSEDLMSEAFYKATLAMDGFRGEGSVKSWLLRIARNLYLSRARRERRTTSLEALEEDGVGFAATGDDPEEGLLRRERGRMIQRALSSLSETDRSVLLLSAEEKMRCKEIADVLGVSVTAVKVRLHRARRRLVDALAREGLEDTRDVGL